VEVITVDSYDGTDIFNRPTLWFKNADILTFNKRGTYIKDSYLKG
jgi:hypothetical protein